MTDEAVAPPVSHWPGIKQLHRALDWLSKRERYVLAAAVIFQLAFLVAMLIRPLLMIATGETILLRVIPVDPRDLFRGDYVTLSYEITRPGWNATNPMESNQQIANRLENMQGQTVYVYLEPEPDGKHWRSYDVRPTPPPSGKFIRGTVLPNGFIQFGIEQFFVQEGQGREYEKAVRDRKLSAEVILTPDGSSQIKRLIIE